MAKKVDLPEPIIPNNSWKIVELGKYVKILNGYPFDSGRFTNSSENTFPLIRIRDVVRGYTETFTDEDCPDEYKIKKDEILIGMDGDFNISRWKSDFGLLNQRVCKIKSASKDLDENFLYYYLPIPLKQINDATPSVTVKHLSSNSLQQLHFPLPTLAEQQRIVNRIETMFAKLDQAQEKAQAVLDSFETRKAAILHKAFTGELTANWRKEKGVLYDSWEEKTLGEICSEIKIGPFGSLLHEDDYIENGIPLVNPKHISNQLINPDTKVSISHEKAEELKSYRLLKNDIVLGRRGEMGRCAPVSENENGWLCGTGSMILRLKPEYQARIYSILISSHKSVLYFEENAVGTTLKNLNEKIVKNLPMPIISLPEQQEIVRILDTVLEKESRAKEAAQTVLDQIALLKKSILARAFRGEL